jgi:hypothetical protein
MTSAGRLVEEELLNGLQRNASHSAFSDDDTAAYSRAAAAVYCQSRNDGVGVISASGLTWMGPNPKEA